MVGVMSNITEALVFSAIILLITTLMSLGMVYSLSRFEIISDFGIFLLSNFILNAIFFGFIIGTLIDENEKLKKKLGEKE
jgi:predicted exporter